MSGCSRRGFIKSVGAVIGSVGLSACTKPYRGEHPSGVRLQQEDGSLSDVASLPLHKATLVYQRMGRPILLIKRSETDILAYESYCPHMECEMNDGVSSQPIDVENGEMRCHLHDSYFDIETGERLRGPANEGDKIPAFEIEIRDGLIFPRAS